MRMLLGCDLGEASDEHGREVERQLWPMLDVAYIACGGHAGDDASMLDAIEHAIANDVRIGAHPSYPDRENFGRISMQIEDETLRASLIEQIERLDTFARARGARIEFLKVHGALYNDAHHDEDIARVIVEAACSFDGSLAIVCASGSRLRTEASNRSLAVLREAFCDRRYLDDGSLVPRSNPRALLLDIDEAAAQASLIAEEGEAVSLSGRRVRIDGDTLTIHSDMENSVERLSAIVLKLGENVVHL